MIIKNGNIHDAVNRDAYVADIALRSGKIAAIGKDLTPLAGEEIYDATGLQVYPGLVEAHCHTGLNNDGTGDKDINDTSEYTGAQFRAIDAINPFNGNIKTTREAGVTTVCSGPGSASVFNGSFVAYKTWGTCIDDMILKYPAAMKCALGQNVRSPKKQSSTRMGAAATFRKVMYEAQEYLAKKEAANGDPMKMPKTDLKMEALIPVLKKEIPIKMHAHRADDICTAIRLAKEFDVNMVLDHVTGGRDCVAELVRAGYPVALGPALSGTSKLELRGKSFETCKVLDEAGLQVAIITDAAVVPGEYLPLSAGLAVKAGMDPFKALQAITINAAKHVGVADRVGSLEVGKDADVVIANGDIMLSITKVVAVFIDGEKRVG